MNDLPDDSYDPDDKQTRVRVGNLCIGPKIDDDSSNLINPSWQHDLNLEQNTDDSQISDNLFIPSNIFNNDNNNNDSDWKEIQYENGTEPSHTLHYYYAQILQQWCKEKEEKKETDDIQYVAYKSLLQDTMPDKMPKRRKYGDYRPFDNLAVYGAFILHFSNRYHYTRLQLQGLLELLLLLQHEGTIPADYFIPKTSRSVAEMSRYFVLPQISEGTITQIINQYQIRIKDYSKNEGIEVKQNSMTLSQQIASQVSTDISGEDESDYVGPYELQNIRQPDTQLKERTIYYCDPIIPMSWYSLCPDWRNMLDFEFKIDENITDDTICDRFNKTKYVKNHLIYDNHEFVKLPNEIDIIKGQVISVRYPNSTSIHTYYVSDIVWFLPDILINPTSNINTQYDYRNYAPHATLVMKLIKKVPKAIILQYISNHSNNNINVDNDIDVITQSNINHHQNINIIANVDENQRTNNNTSFYYIHDTQLINAQQLYHAFISTLNNFPLDKIKFSRFIPRQQVNQQLCLVELPPQYEFKGVQRVHPNVAQNKPHIFGRLYCDAFHTSNMKYRGDSLLGGYFNVLNVKKEIRKQNLMRFVMLASDNEIEYEKAFAVISQQLLKMEKNGIMGFYGGEWGNTSFTWAMTIADMKGRHPLQCRRAPNADQRAESRCHLGVSNGIVWAPCQSLLEDGIITPTKFLNRLHDYLFNVLRLSKKQAHQKGIHWAVTTSKQLAIPSMQYNAALKCVNEPGHIILLGIFKRLFELIWSKMKTKYGDVPLGKAMQGILSTLNKQIKFQCNAVDRISVLGYYGDMNQSWKNWIQQVISLPSVTRWDCNIHILWQFGRWCTQLFCCHTEKERQRLEKALKPLLRES